MRLFPYLLAAALLAAVASRGEPLAGAQRDAPQAAVLAPRDPAAR